MNGKSPSMHRELDLADIQGNIVRPYGRFGFPVTRHLFFNIADPGAGRRFVEQVRHVVTTSVRWGAIDGEADPNAPPRPEVCVNIGFTFYGLYALALPTRTLRAFPEEFIDGMAKRWSILGDPDPSDPAKPDRRDEIWRDADSLSHHAVHAWVSLNAKTNADGTPAAALEERTHWLMGLTSEGGVTLLEGHAGPNRAFQDSSAIMARDGDAMLPTAKEHFGFTDGISDPAFAGQYVPAMEPVEAVGGGKIKPAGKGWGSIATGEFILGHASEAQEYPPSAAPWSFTRNGTFMAYRKLHQNVGSFLAYADAQAELFRGLGGADTPEAARETVMAKMVGRWRSGIPLAAAATYAEAQAMAAQWTDVPGLQRKGPNRTPAESKRLADFEAMLTDFRYAGDEHGATCPVAAHIRRVNPRDALDPTSGTDGAVTDSALTNRRRIMRRGAPYGDNAAKDDGSEHGVIFMAICSSLFRQFEFVQQQWVQYGASFNVGNDTDPLCGLRRPGAKFVIPGDPATGKAPFICADIPQFVEARGGDYFFLPSLTALRQIAEGSVDPT